MLLPVMTFLPLVGALLLMLVPREEEGLHRGFALAVTLVTFLVSLGLLSGFDHNGFNLLFDVEWVKSMGVHFKLGVDGISLWLVLLTTFLMPVVMLSTYSSITKRVREFVVALLILETGMLGTFLVLDLFFFYVFWEVMLVPMYFIIGIWGGDRRLYASIKFVLYTLVGSLLMLVAILYLYVKNHDATGTWTFDYFALGKLVLSPREQLYCFGAFALSFCIKVPLFPLHTWLPDAHVEAPTAGSVILAAVLLKFGTYGMLRFAMPYFPTAAVQAAPLLVVLSVIGIVYGSLVAFAQKDIKKLIAYSSVAHLAFVMLGIALWNVKAIDGALYQMLAHGISTGGLFLCVGVLYERRHTRRIDEYGGVAAVMPRYFGIFVIITMASVGLPGLSGFVGEFLVLNGSFGAWNEWRAAGLPALVQHPKLWVVLSTTGVILSAVYMLYLFQKVMFGPVTNPKNRHLQDLTPRETAVFIPMVLMAFWLGIYPSTFLTAIDPAVQRTVATFHTKFKAAESMNDGDAPKVMSEAFVEGVEAPAPLPVAGLRPPGAPPARPKEDPRSTRRQEIIDAFNARLKQEQAGAQGNAQ